MLTTNNPKDIAVRETAKQLADHRWDHAYVTQRGVTLENRNDVWAWIALYDHMYREEIKKINGLIVSGWFREIEEELDIEIPIVHQGIVHKYAKT